MLRFPNPGSTIDNFINVYRAAFERLNGRVVDLDDIVQAVVEANLATSSGYMGAEAVSRSTREDRSRDPLYNQLKMYAELFRTLGWLHPTPESALNYTFTLLGEQLVAAGRSYWPLLEECILGIAYPTRVLTVKGDFDLRPFAFILRVMLKAGGHLSRDEMILGPLSATTDRGPTALRDAVAAVVAARDSQEARDAALRDLADKRRTQVNTLYNYTRWPIALLRDSGWVEQGKATYRNGRSYQVWTLSAKGRELAERVSTATDIRLDQAEELGDEERAALAVLAHFGMMTRAGFDTAPVQDRCAAAAAKLTQVLDRLGASPDNLLFSPFQSLSLKDIGTAFQTETAAPHAERADRTVAGPVGRDDRSHLFVEPEFVPAATDRAEDAQPTRDELEGLLGEFKTITRAAAAFAVRHRRDTQKEFYPLVTYLFQIMGFPSDYSRAGVNYSRWDACVWVGEHAVPVEIKSPTEEEYLSTKAVRQALENKIVLLARPSLDTTRELTSLVVGYRLPNERGDMSNLIDNVFSAYELRLGVIDLETLAHLALLAIVDGKSVKGEQLGHLRGFLDV